MSEKTGKTTATKVERPWGWPEAVRGVAFATWLTAIVAMFFVPSTPQILAAMLITLSAASLLSGVIFRGKTWCNYICPVGMVERIYTEPIQINPTEHSQCEPCTACKKNCPDIDLEQAYWKEAEDRCSPWQIESWVTAIGTDCWSPPASSPMVTAIDEVEVLSLPGEDFRSVMDRQPGMVRGVMRELVRRLRSAI